ncbi:prolipoprotein diacylglyceryl transferase [Erysipelothrix larvae]|uniref:Phosphatidylglycerol--prolipoprotein diacylglyceryl transferase n=1 Tax=Erysipelothrix larvae TaxID=1514105 RepID=A0A0X8GY27_9FIRM|nr:prolipoprotein diacylglyceryl transferase [Erysipelothrix larvae]AMC92542.1 prolipoprotein diacylglyceryl transferase [Erysipelothrix larvae]
MIQFFPDMKTFVQIGSLSIAWYAVLIVTGAYIAYLISRYNIRKAGYDEEILDNVFIGVMFFGIVGARLWYVLFYNLPNYLSNPIEILMTRDGGLAIQGGLVLGSGFAYYYLKKKGIAFLHWADMIVPNVLLAQALGRWGNFMNQEAYGTVVSESFFNFFPEFIKNGMFINGQYRMPTFFMESSLNVLGWILIVLVLKRFSKPKRGDLVFAYLMWYGVVRFWVEGFRTDSLYFMGIRTAQATSLVFIAVGIFGTFGGFRRFTKRSKPLLLLDFDGTVMDTQALILETFKTVFKERKPDLELTEQDYYSFIGPTLWDSFGLYFEQDEVEEVVAYYRMLNMKLHKEYVKPMDHAIEVLQKLKDEGYTLGIVSSKLKEPIDYALELTNMTHLFDLVYGLHEYEKHKPDPDGILKAARELCADQSQLIYIGDTPTDIVAGRRAGAFTIGYLFDEKREAALRVEEPNRLISDWNELLEILKEDHEWTYNMM